MPNLPTEGIDDDKLVSLSFTRKQFSDFVFKHIQTPSEETRKTTMGFDLTRQRLKTIVDKLDYYVEKNNRLINKDFSTTISIDKSRTLKRGSYTDFFDIDIFDSEFVESISITLSYLIDFGMEDGPPQPEKQVVVLRFDTWKPADITTEIRTTEFTWPAAIFKLVRAELDDMAGELQDVNPISQSSIFFPARVLSNQKHRIDSWLMSIAFLGTAFFATLTTLEGLWTEGRDLESKNENTVYIYNQETDAFVEVDPVTYYRSDDWRERLSLARDSEMLKSYLETPAESDEEEIASSSGVLETISSLPAWLYPLFAFFTIVTWLNFREAARIRMNRIGRIWLSSRKQPKRPSIAASEGVLFSLITGALGSAICTAVIAGVISIVN